MHEASISGKPQLNRQINTSLVLSLIQQEGFLSRADLAKRTGIRATSISAIVQHLVDQNLLREAGPGRSTGGRQPMMLSINPDGLRAVGFGITEDNISGVIIDLSGKAIVTSGVTLHDTSVDSVLDHCEILLEQLCRQSGKSQEQLSGLGVSVPGIIARERGQVILSRPLGWQDVPFESLLTERLNLPTHIMNDAMAGAMAEYFSSESRELRSLLYVLISLRRGKENITSLGCGIVFDGRAYFGEGEMAGELRVDIEHPMVTAKTLLGDHAPKDLDALIAASLAEPEKFNAVWDVFAQSVGGVVARGMDFLSPGRVVIGSDVIKLGHIVGDKMLATVVRDSVAGLVDGLYQRPDKFGVQLSFTPIINDTLARGAILPRLQELSLAPLLRQGVLR